MRQDVQLLIAKVDAIPDGEFISQDISSAIYNSTRENVSWELFEALYRKEKFIGKYFNSAVVASILLHPYIVDSVSKYFKGGNSYAQLSYQDKEDFRQNIIINFNEALRNFDIMKAKFPAYCPTYIQAALRNTFSRISAYDEKKIVEDIKRKIIENGDITEEEAIGKARMMVARPKSLDDESDESKSLNETLDSGISTEEEYDKLEAEKRNKTMVNFFRLNADKNGNIDVLESLGLWREIVLIFADNDLLFDKFSDMVEAKVLDKLSKEEEMEI